MYVLHRVKRCPLSSALLAVTLVVPALILVSCGSKETPSEVNLLKNSSFEDVEDGIPKHWQLATFRGLEGEPEVQYGMDEETAADGQRSWRFRGDPGTRRWLILTQEVEVKNVTHVRLKGWMQTKEVRRATGQHAQCNFLLTCYDENHNRFDAVRFMDKRTRFKTGTIPWMEDELVFRVPDGTRYIDVSCILGCEGTAWFDNVRLSVMKRMAWQTQRTKNFVFHWLPDKPFPRGSIENQQRLFDQYSSRLGIKSDMVVGYYLYPDTASIRDGLRIDGYQYINYDEKEIHTINPNENHEIIHLLTDPYGVPPRAILEGTVYWLHGDWNGESIHDVTARILASGKLPSVEAMIDARSLPNLDPEIWIPASASFVGFLVDLWGPQRLMQLYRAPTGMTSYSRFARAFEVVYGASCEDVEAQWHAALSRLGPAEGSQQEKR